MIRILLIDRVTYGEVARQVGLPLTCKEESDCIADILGRIAILEHEENGPMLSVIVYQSEYTRELRNKQAVGPDPGFHRKACYVEKTRQKTTNILGLPQQNI